MDKYRSYINFLQIAYDSDFGSFTEEEKQIILDKLQEALIG